MKKIFILILIAGGVFFSLNTSFVFGQTLIPTQTGEMSLWLSRMEREMAVDESLRLAQEKIILEEMEQERHVETKLQDFLRRHLNPYLEIESAYDDNIFLSPTRKSDFINTFMPGVKISFLGEDNISQEDFLQLDIGAKLTAYSDHTFMNSQNPYLSFLWNNYFNRYHFNLYEKFKKDVTLESGVTAAQEGKIKYLGNDFDFLFGAEYNRLAFDFGLKRYDYFYETQYKRENNYNENIFSLTGYVKLAPKTRLLFEYDHGIILYPEEQLTSSKNAKYQELWFGLKGDITSKIVGIMKAGYQYRVYRARADWDKPILGMDLVYNFKERTSFFLKLDKTAQQSISTDQNYYDLNKVNFGVINRFAFNPKLSLTTDGLYENDNYASSGDTKRKDKLYGLVGAFKYELQRWASAVLDYTYKERDSNINSNDYVAHIFSLKLKGSF